MSGKWAQKGGGGVSGKWTKGPWSVERSELRGGVYWTVNIPRPGIDPIDIHEDDGGEAHARLIAAAPALYEALYNATSLLAVLGSSGDRVVQTALEEARAALRAAEEGTR